MKASIFLNTLKWIAYNPKKSKVIFWLVVILFPITVPILIIGIIIIKLISPFLKKDKKPLHTEALENDSSEDIARVIVMGIIGAIGAILWNRFLTNKMIEQNENRPSK